MNHIIQFVLSLSLLLSLGCSHSGDSNLNEPSKNYSAAEYLKSVESNALITPGVGLGKLRIEETRGEYLFDEKINGRAYIAQGIFLRYRNADTLIGIMIDNKTVYKTPEGKRIGLTETEIVKEMGEPESRGTKMNKGEVRIGFLPSLNYSGMIITFHEDSSRVIHLFQDEMRK